MACGVNCALANRQVITHLVRQVFHEIVPTATLRLLYDVSHNTCKIEGHEVNGRSEIPEAFRDVGQPVFIGGTMGTCSYILAGQKMGEALAGDMDGCNRGCERLRCIFILRCARRSRNGGYHDLLRIYTTRKGDVPFSRGQ